MGGIIDKVLYCTTPPPPTPTLARIKNKFFSYKLCVYHKPDNMYTVYTVDGNTLHHSKTRVCDVFQKKKVRYVIRYLHFLDNMSPDCIILSDDKLKLSNNMIMLSDYLSWHVQRGFI
jgi:hypothetical protein